MHEHDEDAGEPEADPDPPTSPHHPTGDTREGHGLEEPVDAGLADPLSAYRVNVDDSAQAIEAGARARGERLIRSFGQGGPPVALTDASLWLTEQGEVYRLPREEVKALGQVRSANYRRMRWGVGLYLAALLGFFLHWVIAAALILTGGTLVVLGFLARALLVQVEDERVPPFVIEHGRWRRIRDALAAWHEGEDPVAG